MQYCCFSRHETSLFRENFSLVRLYHQHRTVFLKTSNNAFFVHFIDKFNHDKTVWKKVVQEELQSSLLCSHQELTEKRHLEQIFLSLLFWLVRNAAVQLFSFHLPEKLFVASFQVASNVNPVSAHLVPKCLFDQHNYYVAPGYSGNMSSVNLALGSTSYVQSVFCVRRQLSS